MIGNRSYFNGSNFISNSDNSLLLKPASQQSGNPSALGLGSALDKQDLSIDSEEADNSQIMGSVQQIQPQ